MCLSHWPVIVECLLAALEGYRIYPGCCQPAVHRDEAVNVLLLEFLSVAANPSTLQIPSPSNLLCLQANTRAARATDMDAHLHFSRAHDSTSWDQGPCSL